MRSLTATAFSARLSVNACPKWGVDSRIKTGPSRRPAPCRNRGTLEPYYVSPAKIRFGYRGMMQQTTDSLSRIREIQNAVGIVKAGSYDVANICNLKCEGCLFFEGETFSQHRDSKSSDEWDRLFAGEALRGVNLAYMSGAEPSLVPDRIRMSQRHIPRGIVFTNGTHRIPDDIRYRVHISTWGIGETAQSLRVADVLRKALKNYTDDPRAVFVFTITALNIDDIVPMARLACDHGVPLTFSYFSPTTLYNEKIASDSINSSEYFRLGKSGNSPVLTRELYDLAREKIMEAMQSFPRTVEYSLAYDTWVTQNELYEIDPATDVATNCGVLQTGQIHHSIDHSTDGKCCSPNINCSECRAYAMASTTFFARLRQMMRSEKGRQDWLEAREIWVRHFLPVGFLKSQVAPALSTSPELEISLA